jgi:hypothetical protein
VGGYAEGDQRPHGGEDPERVPVADRIRQAVDHDHVAAGPLGGEEPGQQGGHAHRGDPRQQAAHHPRDRSPAHRDEDGDEAAQVDQGALELQDRLRDVLRPDDRQPDPRREQRQGGAGADLEAAEQDAPAQHQRQGGEPGEGQDEPSPGVRVVAAGRTADQGDGEERARCSGKRGGGGLGRAERAPRGVEVPGIRPVPARGRLSLVLAEVGVAPDPHCSVVRSLRPIPHLTP